jgi:tetratricopeptide (TPR) repeat protein
MSPAEPGAATPTPGQQTAAFVIGVLVLVVLLAAALLGYIPEPHRGLVIRLGVAVAGGGFALFLIGYFNLHLPNGLRIGGPLGVFVLLLLLNPAEHAPEKLAEFFDDDFWACKDNIQHDNFSVAEEDCQRAAEKFPNSTKIANLLALSQYRQGRFRDAINSWKRVLKLGSDPDRAHYNIGLSYFRLGQYAQAVDQANKTIELASNSPSLRARGLFLVADAEFLQWQFGRGPDEHFAKAREAFEAFLEIGQPKYKAHAELACILAVRAGLTADTQERQTFAEQSVHHLNSAVATLRDPQTSDSKLFRVDFLAAYASAGSECGRALDAVWTEFKSPEKYDDVLLRVSQ